VARLVREHGGIENKPHRPLDVSFREDDRRIRKGDAAENFSRMGRLTLNLLKNEKTEKGGSPPSGKNADGMMITF
jgi:predicted transposase YbfD/YdcC